MRRISTFESRRLQIHVHSVLRIFVKGGYICGFPIRTFSLMPQDQQTSFMREMMLMPHSRDKILQRCMLDFRERAQLLTQE